MRNAHLKTALVATAVCSLVGCMSPPRDSSSRPSSLANRADALDRLGAVEAPATSCGVRDLDAERGGIETPALLLEQTAGQVFASDDEGISVKLIPSHEIVTFAWPTSTGPALFTVGEPVHITRKTQWDEASESTIDTHVIVGLQTRAVFIAKRRVLADGLRNDSLTLATPAGVLSFGEIECERSFATGCDIEREQRAAAVLEDGVAVGADSPLSRGEVILDWARGTRFGVVAGCGGTSSPGTIEESLEVAYFTPAPPRDEPELIDVRPNLPEI